MSKFIPLADLGLSEEETLSLYYDLRKAFENTHPTNMVDASDADVLTILPFRSLSEAPEYYDVVNYLTGLYDGKPALKSMKLCSEILLF